MKHLFGNAKQLLCESLKKKFMPVNTVLLVDDSAVLLGEIQRIVSGEGYQTLTACSGREALQKAEQYKPDLIFMDIVMPEMDGYATCRELKNNCITQDIPVVFVSSKTQQADKLWAKMQGAEAYITKPYAADEIILFLNLCLTNTDHDV